MSMSYNQSCLSKRAERLQQVDIPFKEGVNKDEEDFNNFKEEGLGIRDSEEEEVETPPEEARDNHHLLLEEEEAVTITVTREISNLIVAINLATITLNVEGKLHQRYVNKSIIQRRMSSLEEELHY